MGLPRYIEVRPAEREDQGVQLDNADPLQPVALIDFVAVANRWGRGMDTAELGRMTVWLSRVSQ